MAEQTFIAQPVASAGGRVISSPFQFYTTGEDRLRVTSVNAAAGVALKMHSRFVDTGGRVQANADSHIPNTDRTAHTTEHELGIGALLNLTIFASAGAPLVGQTFVIVQLIRGFGAAAIVLGTLLQGYVTAAQALGWPGSPIVSSTSGEPAVRHVIGTTPAAGAAITETVPTGARWELLSIFTHLATSATVAVRQTILDATLPGFTLWEAMAIDTQSASQAIFYTFTQLSGAQRSDDGTRIGVTIPIQNILLAGSVIFVSALSGQPGDQFSAPDLMVREWLEVN